MGASRVRTYATPGRSASKSPRKIVMLCDLPRWIAGPSSYDHVGRTMKIRRTGYERDLRQLPLDATDMFLLTRVVGTVPLSELLAISPCDPGEAMQRVKHLAKLGVVELEGRSLALSVSAGDDDDAVTIRPPPPSTPATATRQLAPPAAARTFARPR
jgi:hypothetical protein